jgi:hypothetical protein
MVRSNRPIFFGALSVQFKPCPTEIMTPNQDMSPSPAVPGEGFVAHEIGKKKH